MAARIEVRVRLKARYLPYLVGLLAALQVAVPHKSWIILLVGLGGAWLVARRWARSLAEGLELSRQRRFGWAQVGDQLQEQFVLTNRGWAPAFWVTVRDHSTLPGYQASRVRPVGGRALIHWFTEGVCRRRGLFTLGPTSLETGDPFGFYRVRLTYPGVSTMTVLPPVLSLPNIEVAPGGRSGEGRLAAARTPDRSISAAGVREYVRGDSLRRIHWPTSARRADLHVRLFDRTPSGDWWIFLDLYGPVQAGQGQQSTEEHGIILAASLAAQGLEQGTAVGLAAAGRSGQTIWLPPRLSDQQRWRILRELALVELGRRPLSRLLTGAGNALKSRSSLVIITADVEGGWLDSLILLLRRGVVPTVLVLDRAAFGSSGDAGALAGGLLDLGVSHTLIDPELLDRPETQPGQMGKWGRTPQGHWEPKFERAALDWKALT